MSTIKVSKLGHGGRRSGSGRGAGDKTKISVSVDEDNWQTALSLWTGTRSSLVDNLIENYVSGEEMARAQ